MTYLSATVRQALEPDGWARMDETLGEIDADEMDRDSRFIA